MPHIDLSTASATHEGLDLLDRNEPTSSQLKTLARALQEISDNALKDMNDGGFLVAIKVFLVYHFFLFCFTNVITILTVCTASFAFVFASPCHSITFLRHASLELPTPSLTP